MKIAYRYILAQHIGPFIFGLAIITFVLIMDFILDILNMVISKGLPILVILEVFALNLAWMLALSVPMAVLVGVLMAFGRLSADNEITAFKACGVPFYRLLMPVLIAASFLTVFLIWFNDKVLPESNHRARVLMSDITHKKPAWNLEPGVFIDNLPGYHLLIQHVDDDRIHVKGITIYDRKDRDYTRTIVASRGTIEFMDDKNTLKIDLFDGEIHEPDPEDPTKYRRLSFENQSLYIADAGSDLIRSSSEYRGDREQSIAMMNAKNKGTMEKIRTARRNIDRKIDEYFSVFTAPKIPTENISRGKARESPLRALEKMRGDLKSLRKQARYEVQNISGYQRQYNSLLVEIHKKYSIPVACIVFVLLGGPLGVMARKGGMGTGLGLSLFFFILYWAFLIEGEDLADRRIISAFWAMWNANIILGSVGLYLLYKTVKESAFISLSFRALIPGFLKKD
jgi:lipopolysaccharide export system permease protein